jgi:hypothetical protein
MSSKLSLIIVLLNIFIEIGKISAVNSLTTTAMTTMTTSMAKSSMLCQSCSNTSFVSPLIESTMVNNCTQLGLNCPIGQIVTVGYTESYYYYNNNYTYYYNYVEGVNETM